MSFAPVVPVGGVGGWMFLKRTMAAQTAAFVAAPQMQRDEAYFRERIGAVKTAEDLVSDRRLLKVALGAYGLDGDLDNRFFIRKVLQDGTLDPEALANRLSDTRYADLSAAFGFGDFAVPSTQISTFADKILARYERRQFEIAVGDQSTALRLALDAEREVPALAGQAGSDDARWYRMMGSAPLREVFETAFGLPASFASVDIDRQLGLFKAKAEQMFGDDRMAQFSDPAALDRLLRRFLLLADRNVKGAGATPAAGALQLLRAGRDDGAEGVLALLA